MIIYDRNGASFWDKSASRVLKWTRKAVIFFSKRLYTKVERIIVGLDAPTVGVDANQDGNINALDITKVERIIAGLD